MSPPPSRPPRLRASLLAWYSKSARDLPWRRTKDPYRIWVSEVMLQQTQVATVIPYYERFLERFPNATALARADEDDVLAAWSGLGYYRRARSLQAGARAVTERHGGELPHDATKLMALPGIGRYTAGAVASIAFDQRQAILDGNVRRVLSRIFGVESATLGARRAEATLWDLATQLVDGDRPGDLNQALMELGALVCKPRNPECTRCPARKGCVAYVEQRVGSLPSPKRRSPTVSVEVSVAWIERGGRVLLERPDGTSPLRGKWDLPAGTGPLEALAQRLKEDHGLELGRREPLGNAKHAIMQRRLDLTFYRCRLERGRTATADQLRWVELAEIERIPVSGATRKAVRHIFSLPSGRANAIA